MKKFLISDFKGDFKYCLKDQCEKSCCNPKNWQGETINHCAYETLSIHNEAQKINEKIGQEIIKVNMWAKNMTGCSKDNKCLFEDNRPASCKIFPLSIEPKNPIKGDTKSIQLGIRNAIHCPQAEKAKNDIDFIIETIDFLTTFFECKVELTGILKEIELSIISHQKAINS